ncbi:unnamed protein product [Brachionus calyciflorus]|uniref:GapR-like DNA-binding domain-containing protein n=1 Tax=Brachionus calyciflorus TaxID=104777 RepID=A0A814KVD2_9BILA|nr:unnamed protein product [Brachionus calyciflorus]
MTNKQTKQAQKGTVIAAKKPGVTKKKETMKKTITTKIASQVSQVAPSHTYNTQKYPLTPVSNNSVENVLKTYLEKIFTEIKTYFDDFRQKLNNINQSQRVVREKQALLLEKIESLENSKKTINGFPKDVYDEAKAVGIELNVNFVHNDESLLTTSFNPNIINLFGTKLMSKIFTQEELAAGHVEEEENDYDSNDSESNADQKDEEENDDEENEIDEEYDDGTKEGDEKNDLNKTADFLASLNL